MTFATWRRKDTCGPPVDALPTTSRVHAALAAMLLAAGCLTAVVASAATTPTVNAAAPPPPRPRLRARR